MTTYGGGTVLWRVRTTLQDRPGALAGLARACGEAGVNILGLQVFPGMDKVTDELVLRTPSEWGREQVVALLEDSGGTEVGAAPCSEAALGDQATRFVMAARSVLERPESFPEVAARLFDAGEPGAGATSPSTADEPHVMDLDVLGVSVQVQRDVPFTGTELARGAALAELVGAVLRSSPAAPAGLGGPTEHVVAVGRVQAVTSGVIVGEASWRRIPDEPGACRLRLEVEPVWRRRGVGAGLLRKASRAAADQGATELVVLAAADNPAVMPVVLAAGLRGRIKMTAEQVSVRISLRQLVASG